jgi:hypothetical protein
MRNSTLPPFLVRTTLKPLGKILRAGAVRAIGRYVEVDEVRVTAGEAFETGGNVETNLIVESHGSAVVGGSVLGRLTAGDCANVVVIGNVEGKLTAGPSATVVVRGVVRGDLTVGDDARVVVGSAVSGKIVSAGKLVVKER